MKRSLLGVAGAALVLGLVAAAATAAPPQADVRFATFNASLNRGSAGLLTTHLSNPAVDDQFRRQAKNVAEVVQRVRPEVLLVNEFDPLNNDAADPGPEDLFRDNFLEVSQNGAQPIEYPYAFIAPSNTGVPSGKDLDNSGGAPRDPNDAFGFGFFPGQFGMVVYSRYPIDYDAVRTFQLFKWKDMPGNLVPTPFYSPERGGDPAAVVEEPLGRSDRDRRQDGPLPRLASDTAGVRRRGGPQRPPESRRNPILGRLHQPGKVALHLRRQWSPRRPEAGRALRDRRRPELRSARRRQHPGLDPAADRASAREREADSRERGSGRGRLAPGRRQLSPTAATRGSTRPTSPTPRRAISERTTCCRASRCSSSTQGSSGRCSPTRCSDSRASSLRFVLGPSWGLPDVGSPQRVDRRHQFRA